MIGDATARAIPPSGGRCPASTPPTASAAPSVAIAERDPRPAPGQRPPDAQREDAHEHRVDVDDERRERRRDRLERGVVRRRVQAVDRAQAERAEGQPAGRPAQGRPARRRGEEPGPGERRPDAEPPDEEGEPVEPGGVDRLGEQRAGTEADGRHHDEQDARQAPSIHAREPSSGPEPRQAAGAKVVAARSDGRRRASRRASSSTRLCVRRPTLSSVQETTRTQAVADRMPTLLDEPIKAIKGRDPVCVQPGTSLADCLLAIQKTGTGDSVVVADADGRLRGVLTERDIVARLVGTDRGPVPAGRGAHEHGAARPPLRGPHP